MHIQFLPKSIVSNFPRCQGASSFLLRRFRRQTSLQYPQHIVAHHGTQVQIFQQFSKELLTIQQDRGKKKISKTHLLPNHLLTFSNSSKSSLPSALQWIDLVAWDFVKHHLDRRLSCVLSIPQGQQLRASNRCHGHETISWCNMKGGE